MNTPIYRGRDWTISNIPHWQRWFAPFINQPVRALTIGCYEGRSDRWLLENILTHEKSHLTCIDPFSNEYYASLVDGPIDRLGPTLDRAYSNFVHNTQPWVGKTRLLRLDSFRALHGLPMEPIFDFAYIDGAHLARIVLEDSVAVWQRLIPGAVLVWDDYRWRAPSGYKPPKPAIDAFLDIYNGYWSEREQARNQLKVKKLK